MSCRLPKNWAKALQMQGIVVSATCENLFTVCNGSSPYNWTWVIPNKETDYNNDIK